MTEQLRRGFIIKTAYGAPLLLLKEVAELTRYYYVLPGAAKRLCLFFSGITGEHNNQDLIIWCVQIGVLCVFLGPSWFLITLYRVATVFFSESPYMKNG